MSRSLPEQPNLDHLRRQAKALRDAARGGDPEALARITAYLPVPADRPVALSAAQLVIAREYGFASWPRLHAEVRARTMSRAERVAAFLGSSVDGPPSRAVRLLAGDPGLAAVDIRTAAVLGEVERVRELITAEPRLVEAVDAERGWSPLLYVCHSRWHQVDPARADGLTEVARVLLDAGASPDSNNGGPARAGCRSALYGAAGIANNPAITALLLERGADPDDDESVYHSVYHRDHACLRLLLAHGAKADGTNALAAAIGVGDVTAVRLLVAAGADPGRRPRGTAPAGHLADRSINPLVSAAASDTAEVMAVLLEAGADPDSATRDGISPVRQAVRRGADEVAELLLRYGATDDVSPMDRFLGACARGDRAAASRHSGLLGQLSDVDRAALPRAAGNGPVAAVELMLELGFPVDARNDNGETGLHQAAYAGRADVVRVLLGHGATVDARDAHWDSTPLGFATVGSGEHPAHRPGADWPGVVRALLAAGAERADVWIEEKPPSEEVAAVLAEYGITGPNETEEPEPGPADPALAPLAERLRAALSTTDPEPLAPLLHPRARWGSCADREQVLDWYRAMRASGLRVQVEEIQLRGEFIVLDLHIQDPAGVREGAVRQAFRVRDGLIAEIRDLPA